MLDKSIDDITQSVKADDFTKIKGIAASVQEKLQQAGISTYADLASTYPEVLASILSGLIGFSTNRIERENWVGQAKSLALLSGQINERLEVDPYESRQYYAVFNVQLLLDSNKQVRRTQVTEVRTQNKTFWPGWDANRLSEFILQSADLTMKSEQSISPVRKTSIDEDVKLTPDTSSKVDKGKVDLQGEIRIKLIEFIGDKDYKANALFLTDNPVRIHLLLDLSDITLEGSNKLNVESFVYAKPLSTNNRILVARSQDVVTMAKQVDVEVQGDALSPGEYRLDVAVIVRPGMPGTKWMTPLTCLSEGKLVKIRKNYSQS